MEHLLFHYVSPSEAVFIIVRDFGISSVLLGDEMARVMWRTIKDKV